MKRIFKVVLLILLLTLITSVTLSTSTQVTYAQGSDVPSTGSEQAIRFGHITLEEAYRTPLYGPLFKIAKGLCG